MWPGAMLGSISTLGLLVLAAGMDGCGFGVAGTGRRWAEVLLGGRLVGGGASIVCFWCCYWAG